MIYIIYVVVTVIVSFILTLIKVKIDEWFDSPSMKRSRLSLNRDRCDKMHYDRNEVVEITDDESSDSDSSSNLREEMQQEKYSRVRNCGMTVPNDVACVPSVESSITNTFQQQQQQQQQHDLSNDASTDENVVVINDVPMTSNKSKSMFNWGKTNLTNKIQNNLFLKDNTPHGSRIDEPEGACSKRQRLMNDTPEDDTIDSKEFKKEASPPKVTIQYEKMIGGIKVKFPVNPYSCQIGIVNSVILGCKKKQNCLLESPTGSGKTLALLCGVLAWQEQHAEILKQNNEADMENSSCADDESSEGENFFLNLSQCCDKLKEDCDKIVKKHESRKVPKVYYGTRTHKQIEQVVRELRKTAYRDKRMTILSGRERSCIQDTKKDKNELCNELLDPRKFKRCPYYNDKNKKYLSSFNALQNFALKTPWDIEDLVSLGKKVAACPYYGARSLMANAEIIFCPYNYIIDPSIRESMQINLKDSVVILDEAHNIEDICRQVVNVDLRDDDLNVAAKECEKLSKDRVANCNTYSTIQNYLSDTVKFLDIIDVKHNDNQREMCSDHWIGSYFLQMLNVNKIGNSRFPDFLRASSAAISDFDKMKEDFHLDKILPTISRETKKILEHLCFVIQVLTLKDFVDDYRAYVIETVGPRKDMLENTWISTKNYRIRTMKLICMNPAIVFAPLARTVRSVILASGTLTPMSSFQSELGTQFHYRLNLKHIITKEQMYVRCISHGPTKKPLSAKFETVNSFEFQDELGRLIVQVCDAVPYGVLCFFSSYGVMRKILERWEVTDVWKELSALKQIFVEPQNNNQMLMHMEEYREVIRESSSISFRKPSGAIFFAVFRGKVAEGIDFKDNEARCVLAIGIPYAYNKLAEVSLKMRYNDSKQSAGLLRGSEWYTVNAFRALNQALGRCIRHKDDWGAVLLVDERFQQKYNVNYLPNWIKSMWLENANYNLSVELEDFVALQVARERGKEYNDRKKICDTVKD